MAQPSLRVLPAPKTTPAASQVLRNRAPAPAVYVRRGPYVESVHRLAVAIVDAAGDVCFACGDTDRPLPVRSLAKPFIAAELVRSGAANTFGLSERHLSLAAGSHDGEAVHIECVHEFLHRLELDPTALACGPRTQGSITVGPAAANNCSGKHAAVLALCKHWNLPIQDYIEAGHPVQRRLQPLLQRAFEADDDAPTAIDGCGMPIFSASLAEIARAYSRFVASREAAEMRVRTSVANSPDLFGGTKGNFDSDLASQMHGAVFGKIGAEGLHADAVTITGLGIAVKVVDGNPRALALAVPALLRRFDNVDVRTANAPDVDGVVPLLNAAGTDVGTISIEGV